jgi:GINS complex subunit 2
MAMSPWCVSFFTENETVNVIPKIREPAIYLMSGKIGPFEPGISVSVPIWVAVMLRQRHMCRIVSPDWMTVGNFQRIKVSASFIIS